MKPPQLDNRTYRDIKDQALMLARSYFPAGQGTVQWDSIHEPVNENDPAYRMLEIFARLIELLIRRFNKIPVKNFLSFLDMVGVEQHVGNPAEVPVTFLPAKSALTGGDIPAGTQVATTQTDTADAQVFETRNAFYATAAKLKKVINLLPQEDKYSDLPLIELPPKPGDLEDESRTITAFNSDNDSLWDIEHAIYLASETLFQGKEPVKLDLYISLSGNKDMFKKVNLTWKTYNTEKKDWDDILDSNVSDPIDIDLDTIKIEIDPFSGTGKSEVNSREDFWIACHFTGEFPTGINLPIVEKIEGNVSLTEQGTAVVPKIDAAFSNNSPIDLSKPFYPFGQRPQYGDAFYIGSKQAFAPDIQSVIIKFEILPYTDKDLEKIFKNIKVGTNNAVTISTKIDWEYLSINDVWQPFQNKSFQHELTVTKDSQTGPGNFNIQRISSSEAGNGTFFSDGSLKDINIEFPGFDDLALNELNKQENYWIRAVVKSVDAYGKDAYLEPTGTGSQPFAVIGPTFIPPIIEKIEISSLTYKSKPIPVDSIQTKNNFQYTVPEGNFTPFIPITSHPVGDNPCFFHNKPALYLGFDKEFGDVYTSMFFLIKETLSAAGYALEQGKPHITWEYAADGYSWKPLDVNDNTEDLTTSGTVAFTGPNDSIKATLFKSLLQDEENPQQELYWYRARLAEGYYDYPPCLKGIYLNTVMADQQTLVPEDQVIGSGNGTANQKLILIRVPILAGDIWVREAEKPIDEELENHKQEFLKLPGKKEEIETTQLVREITTGEGKEETWVQWLKVPNFLASGPRSRHYTLDAVKGEITFGNGEKGLIPPAGKDNIIIGNYRTGGGEQANKSASPLAVKELKSSLPYIDKVFNVQNAVGGSNPWNLEQTMVFGPQSVKNRDRAVTVEDYEWMVLQQFSQVARARCIPTRIPAAGGSLSFKPGAATMIIVPKSSQPKPQPTKGLLKNIRDYLTQKAPGTIFEHIHVIGPNFQEINITARVKPLRPGESSIVERRIIKTLEDFFHPLTGGEQGEGWNFGRDVYISEVYAVIERTQGVECVKNARFTNKPGDESIEVGPNCLVYSGPHDIEMEMN